jgi:hypothetical protein
MYVEKESKQRYVGVVKSGNGRWVPKVEEPYTPGSYYLRYRTNEKRVWESVGADPAACPRRAEGASGDGDKRSAATACNDTQNACLRDRYGTVRAKLLTSHKM